MIGRYRSTMPWIAIIPTRLWKLYILLVAEEKTCPSLLIISLLVNLIPAIIVAYQRRIAVPSGASISSIVSLIYNAKCCSSGTEDLYKSALHMFATYT